ncbi:MAG: 50S ribosomal protein L23 [Parcubacteria group bacterium RIFCSPHIGHO2_01_FULL_56_18]|nr:MAG: 50S ribosomal protein L23 [Parcubacteria group bacterium RIFCSPHIGHO2_01_FULL_56_18]
MKTDHAFVLLNPRITEKATFAASNGVYVFDVAPGANKKQILFAVNALYNVKPRAVRIVNIRSKIVRNARTGKAGMKSGGKKAYVYLAKGETITIS